MKNTNVSSLILLSYFLGELDARRKGERISKLQRYHVGMTFQQCSGECDQAWLLLGPWVSSLAASVC